MNQTMYIATWDSQIVLVTKRYSHWINEIFSTGASFNIDKKILSLTHWNVSDTFHKFQLCTSNLKVPIHESNYVYRYVRYANSFKDKAILTLGNQDFELGCIIQYRWKFCPSHIEMCLTRSVNFSYVHVI